MLISQISTLRGISDKPIKKDADRLAEVKQTLIVTWQENGAPLLKRIGSAFILLCRLNPMNLELNAGAMFFTKTQINIFNNSSEAIVRTRSNPHDLKGGQSDTCDA